MDNLKGVKLYRGVFSFTIPIVGKSIEEVEYSLSSGIYDIEGVESVYSLSLTEIGELTNESINNVALSMFSYDSYHNDEVIYVDEDISSMIGEHTIKGILTRMKKEMHVESDINMPYVTKLMNDVIRTSLETLVNDAVDKAIRRAEQKKG